MEKKIMNYKIICDYCENFISKTECGHINDHQTKETFVDILKAINLLGYDCEIFGGVQDLISAYEKNEKFDDNSIFINLSDGTDKPYSRVQVPVVCDLLNVQYSGGGTFETALTSNKYYSSLAVKNNGLIAPKNVLVTNIDEITMPSSKVLIKPNSEGSSIGITEKSVCNDLVSTKKQTEYLLSKFSEVIIEEYIPGYDATCFIIGNQEIALNEVLLIEHHNKIIFENEVLGYKEHMLKTRKFIPCEGQLPKTTENAIKDISIKIKNIFNIKDFCRIDYRITKEQQVYFLEINTVPAISKYSQVGVICNKLGISFEDFVNLIIQTVTNRFNHV